MSKTGKAKIVKHSRCWRNEHYHSLYPYSDLQIPGLQPEYVIYCAFHRFYSDNLGKILHLWPHIDVV
jgi:hypothetical protein